MRAERPVRPRLAIVTPVFNEAENLALYAETVRRVLLSAPDIDASVLLVDDGSTDASWSAIDALSEQDPRFRGLRLSRNFGAHLALAAGFDHVGPEADIAATLPCDLQDPPDTILGFVAAWRGGAQIVWGARNERADSPFRRRASSLLETILRRYAMPKGSKFRTGSFLLMDRVVLDCFLRFREHSRVTFALVAWTGFDQEVVHYDRKARVMGRSGWTLGRMLNSAYDVFVGFSPLPAKAVTMLGFGVAVLSFLAILYLVVDWLVRDVQPGWTGIMATTTIFFGVLFMMVGMIAEYLYRIFIETKGRPLYFIAETAGAVNRSPASADDGVGIYRSAAVK